MADRHTIDENEGVEMRAPAPDAARISIIRMPSNMRQAEDNELLVAKLGDRIESAVVRQGEQIAQQLIAAFRPAPPPAPSAAEMRTGDIRLGRELWRQLLDDGTLRRAVELGSRVHFYIDPMLFGRRLTQDEAWRVARVFEAAAEDDMDVWPEKCDAIDFTIGRKPAKSGLTDRMLRLGERHRAEVVPVRKPQPTVAAPKKPVPAPAPRLPAHYNWRAHYPYNVPEERRFPLRTRSRAWVL